MDFAVVPARLTRLLAMTVVGLLLAHLAGQFSRFYLGHGTVFGLVRMFNLGAERNIPTYFSAALLLLSAFLLLLISWACRHSRSPFSRHWLVLGTVFCFLSLDEALQFHENFGRLIQASFQTQGVFYFAWVIPYGLLTLAILCSSLKFLAHLPSVTRLQFLLAGILFVVGALGLELVEGWYFGINGRENITYVLFQTVEETLEMVGMVLFIHALTSYISTRFTELRLRIG